MKTEASLHSHFDHDRVWDMLPYYSESGLESFDHAAVRNISAVFIMPART